MSIHNKILLSLVNDKLTIDDILPSTGFSGIYTLDINRPYLTNHIFLLYKFVATKDSKKTKEKLESFDNFYNKRKISIDGVLYWLYSFTINEASKHIMNNTGKLLLKKDKIQICKFWNFVDADINEFIFGNVILEEFENNTVPEEDYNPKDFLIYDEKREKLVISSSL